MIKPYIVTLLVSCVLVLASGMLRPAIAATSSNSKQAQKAATNKSVISTDQLPAEQSTPNEFSAIVLVSRSTSLNDFQDGTRKDGVDYLIIPAYKFAYGSISGKISYSQDLRDLTPEASDWNDTSVTYALEPNKWEWSQPYLLTLTPTVTAVIPTNKKTIKRDQLQGGLVLGVSVGIIPDGIAPARDGAWNLAIGVSAGRLFHQYEVDINGKALNQYSSNQTLNLGYTYKSASISTEYIHKTRWTYAGNLKDSFEWSQELGYSITEKFAVAIGHSNVGSGLKANATESNFELINENDSTVYGQLAVSF